MTTAGNIRTAQQGQTTLEIRLANMILDCDIQDTGAAAPISRRYVSVRHSAHTVSAPRDEEVPSRSNGMWSVLSVTTALLTVLTILSQII